MTAEREGRVLYNFLDEALLGIEDAKGVRFQITLPGLLARLSCGESTSLTALQAHQQHPLHAFLVQLAAISLERCGETEIAHDEGAWRELLLAAAARDGGGAEAFALVVEDLSKPAFMQAPIPENRMDVLKNVHLTPSEEIDVLITSKNHDVKVGAVSNPTPELWLFALVSLQTSQGFLGAGNYGVARMNGGFSSRPCIAFAAEQTMSSRFVRDTGALKRARDSLLARGFSREGVGLVWCRAWDGVESLGFEQLDPYFIEICRRVRLGASHSGEVIAHRGSSKAARIDGSAAAGNTGDAWTPVAVRDGKALTIPEAGFTYDRVREFIFPDGEWAHGAAGALDDGGTDRYWVGQVLVRGQGKTGGYHERWVPIPPKARSFFSKPESRQAAGKMAQSWVDAAASVRLKVLKPALLTLIQAAPAKLKFDDHRADAFLRRFEFTVDQIFFPRLFGTLELPPDECLAGFQRQLFAIAKRELQAACGSVPLSAIRKHRSIAVAERVLDGAARKHLALAFPRREEEHQGVAS